MLARGTCVAPIIAALIGSCWLRAEPEIPQLTNPITFTLSRSESRTFRIVVAAGEYLRIAAVAPETSVSIVLLDQAGSPVARSASLGGSGGSAEVAAIGQQSFQVTISLARKDVAARNVTASVSVRRAATIDDERDVGAFRSYAQLAALRESAKGAITDVILAAFDGTESQAGATTDTYLQSFLTLARLQALAGAARYNDVLLKAEGAGKIADKRVQAAMLYAMAFSRLQTEDIRGSIPLFEQAISLQRQMAQTYELSTSLHNLGAAQFILGDCAEALTNTQQAYAIRRELGDPARQAYSLLGIAKDYFCLGDAQHALDKYNEVLPLWRELKDARNEAAVWNDRGVIYSYLGSMQQAEESHQAALGLRKKFDDSAGIAESLNNLGQLRLAQSAFDPARTFYGQALDLARANHHKRGEAYALQGLGEAFGNADSGRAEDLITQSIGLFHELGDRAGEAWSWQVLGKVHLAERKLEQAQSDFDRALLLERETGDRIAESVSLVGLAEVCRMREDRRAALSYADQAIAVIETARSSLLATNLRSAFLSSKREAFALRIRLLFESGDRHNSRGEAFATSEEAHARGLLDALTSNRSDLRNVLEPRLRAREDRLDSELNSQAERLARASSAQALTRFDLLLEQRQELDGRIREANPHYANLALPLAPGVADVQKYGLDADTVLLEYFTGPERSFVWAVTSTSLRQVKLPGVEKLDGPIRKLYAALTERNRRVARETAGATEQRQQLADVAVNREAGILGEILIGPVAEWIGRKRIVIVPDGPLSLIPFPLLALKTGARLGAGHEIVYLPAASVLIEIRREHRESPTNAKKILIVADPVFSKEDERSPVAADSRETLPRLRWSREEAQRISAIAGTGRAEQVLGLDANSSVLRRRDLSTFRFIHIASHALLDTTRPELSSIAFSTMDAEGHPREGRVRLYEIYNLSLNARLVVLSACRTALGPEVSGEGIIGLNRGFLYAGARAVVATLWSVDDQATAQFMERFYRGLWVENLGPAAALRSAQQWMMSQERWRSPYYWAAFILTGEWR